MAFEIGARVHVFINRMDGRPTFEGTAVIRKRDVVSDRYLVAFESDIAKGKKDVYWRFVSPGECQSNPHEWLAKAQAQFDAAEKRWKEQHDAEEKRRASAANAALNKAFAKIIAPKSRKR